MNASFEPITRVAGKLGIRSEHLIPYGSDEAKVALGARGADRPRGRLVLVSAITPVEAGEASRGRRGAVSLQFGIFGRCSVRIVG